MPDTSSSKFAAYQAIIALAWADNWLDSNEVDALHDTINATPHLTDEQKQSLNASIDTPHKLEDVWHKISDKRDRALVINVSYKIFYADGDFCANEQALYDRIHAKHLGTLDMNAIRGQVSKTLDQKSSQLQSDQEKWEDEEGPLHLLGFFKAVFR